MSWFRVYTPEGRVIDNNRKIFLSAHTKEDIENYLYFSDKGVCMIGFCQEHLPTVYVESCEKAHRFLEALDKWLNDHKAPSFTVTLDSNGFIKYWEGSYEGKN